MEFTQSDCKNRWRVEEEMYADGTGLRDGFSSGGRIACRAAGRDENARGGDSEAAVSARRAGIAASGIDARGLQSAGKRSGALPRFGGSAAAASCRREGPAGNQCGGGCDQSCFGRKPAAGWLVRLRACGWGNRFSCGKIRRNVQGHRQVRLESGRIADLRRYRRAARQRDERFGTDDGKGRNERSSRGDCFLQWRGKSGSLDAKTRDSAAATCCGKRDPHEYCGLTLILLC